MDPIEDALRAVGAAHDGDSTTALEHIARAQLRARTTARRERQIVEIAAAAVAGACDRAVALALEHASRFPEDAALLARLATTP